MTQALGTELRSPMFQWLHTAEEQEQHGGEAIICSAADILLYFMHHFYP